MNSNAWSPTAKRAVTVVLFVLLLLALYVFRRILPPVLIAAVLAYLLKPLVDSLERDSRLPRTLSVVLVYLVVLLVLSLIPATVVPVVIDQIQRLNLDFQAMVADVVTFLSRPIVVFGITINTGDVVGDLEGTLQNLVQPAATQTINLLLNLASSLLWTISVLVIAFYLLRDGDRLPVFLDRMTPPGHRNELRRVREEISVVWKGFFRGQLVLGLVVGTAVWLLMTAVGMPSAGLLGLLAGLLEVVPNFGPVIATIPALIMALLRGSSYLPISNFWFAVLVLGLYILVQQVENNYLVPRIMSRRLQLHPVVVFVGMIGGASLAGVLGLLLAAPTLATLRVMLHYVYAKILDQDPFPIEVKVTRELYPGEIDAVLFDLDGTLIDTDDTALGTLARLLQPVKGLLPGKDPAQTARVLLMALETPVNRLLALLDRLGLDERLYGLAERLRRVRGLSAAARFCPVVGVCEMMDELSGRYRLGVVTTRSRADAQAFLQQQSLAGRMAVVVAREDTRRQKPHPAPVLLAAERLNVLPERCLMVGDTTVDVKAACAAGAWSVGVLCGFGERGELERVGADVILETTGDLIGVL